VHTKSADSRRQGARRAGGSTVSTRWTVSNPLMSRSLAYAPSTTQRTVAWPSFIAKC